MTTCKSTRQDLYKILCVAHAYKAALELILLRSATAVYIIFVQITHQIQVLTEPLCLVQAILYVLPKIERGT